MGLFTMNRKREEMSVGTVLFKLLCILGIVDRTCGVVDYCSDHTLDTNSSYLQFTKEIGNKEYAVAGKFKSVHCCAKGYRSIEWYKDGAAYPWPSSVSNLILYPESANQTVYAQTVSALDKGNYSCVVRNDSHVISHSVELVVIEAEASEVGYMGVPRPTYKPKDRYAMKGDSVRFFCEAFVGRVDLPDAKSEVKWWRSIPSSGEDGGPNALGDDVERQPQLIEMEVALTEGNTVSDPTDGVGASMNQQGDAWSRHHHHHHAYHHKHHTKPKPRFHQEVVSREDYQILGAYLLIRDVQNEDFGEYSCAIRSAGAHTLHMSARLREGEEEEMEKMEEEVVMRAPPDHSLVVYMVAALSAVILACLVVMLVLSWKKNVYHHIKKYCRKRESGDGKDYGICVFYEDKGKAFSSETNVDTPKSMALSSIIPTFESHHGYECFTHPIPAMDQSPLTDGEKALEECVQIR